jgi:transposase-like protein
MELHMNPFKGRHFQRDIILWAVRWYCKYGISYRELQEMLAERGVNVDHSTIYRWVQRYAPEMEKRLRWYATIKGIEVMHYAKARPQHFIMVIPWAKCAW